MFFNSTTPKSFKMRKYLLHTSNIIGFLIISFCSDGSDFVNSFYAGRTPVPHKTHPALTVSTTQLGSIGNLISGITNVPPSSPLISKELGSALVAGTSLQDVDLKCVYKGTKDGWSAVDFHRCVDDKGSGLVVALSRSGQLFGGFNPVGWRSTDDYFNSNAAFLWYASSGNKAIKSPVLPGGNAAVFDYATGGPCFGASDLVFGEPRAAVMGGFAGPDAMDIASNAGNLKQGRCSLGGTYDTQNSWPVRGNFQLVQLEVYCNGAISDSTSSANSWWPF